MYTPIDHQVQKMYEKFSKEDPMPGIMSVVNPVNGELDFTYCCRRFSKVVELISRPAGISLMSETKFTKHSPAL